MRRLTAATVLGVLIAGCGSTSTSHSSTATGAARPQTTPTSVPQTFSGGYEQAWGQMKQVGAEVRSVLNRVKRAQAKHQTVPDAELAREFALFASRFEPALIEFQGLTPPARVRGAYRSMAAAAAGVAGSLRNFSNDANANHTSLAAHDLGSYFSYAVTVDKAALEIYNQLGLK